MSLPSHFNDRLIKIPKEFSHTIEKIQEDQFYKKFNHVVMSCYFTGKKDPIHHEELNNQRQAIDNFEYMKPLYESCYDLNLHLIIFYDNLSNEFVKTYTKKNIIFRKTKLTSNLSINDERFIIYYEYLLDNPYQNIFTSDISDVYLIKNPFHLMENISLPEYKELSCLDKPTFFETKHYIKSFKLSKNYSLSNLLFIGTNTINNGPNDFTPQWFERRQYKIDQLNEALQNNKKYKPFKPGNFQIYNPGTIMANYNTYMCFLKKFIKILFICCKIRENNNWNMVIANYVCFQYLMDEYDPETFHSKYIFTGFPFNSLYQRNEKANKTLAYVIHK